MNKKNRIALFHQDMASCLPAKDPSSALKMMQGVLAKIENTNAPQGSGHMTILDLTNKDVQAYGAGGYAIPLIGYMIFLNPNGAIGIRDDWNGGFSLEMPGDDGKQFVPIRSWSYQLPQ
ncbi:hypothetical protein DP090_019540 [Pseudomonas sp. MDMC216]|jgi:hypothetical protein|nr:MULTISPECIES: hypothetical protein [Pseudomonas]MDH1558739.1 hypothetical protein [Pseudomonas chengduensis]MDI5995215.1 hypothetical protein [Pseudomonas sp. MDMC216]MDI6008697.1 hypothetical protein [Pseudomonas sp. MDMC17]RAR31771.1 hypothetical protein DP092_19905 [Pseudomonas sp. MDMC224]